MSFLNSVLSSIGGGAGQSQPGRPAPTNAPATKPTQFPRSDGSSNGVGVGSGPKRKAEGDLGPAPAKTARKDTDPARPSPVSRTGTASPLVKPSIPSSSNPLPYRGTAQSSSSASTVRRVAPTSASAAKPGAFTAASRPAAKPSPGPSVAPVASGPAPKKGSYQEILARAKAAQQSKAPVAAIKHKPVEKLSKKDKLMQEAEAKNKQALGGNSKVGPKGQARGSENSSAKDARAVKAVEPAKEKKKPVDLGYQGTMRPRAKEPVYQGTMHKGSASKDRGLGYDRSRSTSLGAKPGAKSRYSYFDEEDAEEEEDYDSEATSDMEAGMFDMDREEELSLRVARKEDEQALREEEELKRRKAERKQMLARMNEQAKKKTKY